MKKCRQCGETKQLDEFRDMYQCRGKSTICNTCERINSRMKYLRRKSELNADEKKEYDLIEALYTAQRAKGLKPPVERKKFGGVLEEATQMLEQAKSTELDEWMKTNLSKYTPDELADVYDNLRLKYKPMIGTGPNGLPVYDMTYAKELDAVAKRFDDYEDAYYNT